MMVDKIEAPDPATVVFRLKFATAAFLPALADPFAFIYQKENLEKDPHWYEKNILGSGPFKFVAYETGQSITGVRNPDYYHQGLPYLDGIIGILRRKQATRVEAIRSDRAAIEFRGLPPAARDELHERARRQDRRCRRATGIAAASSPRTRSKKPFDDVARAPRPDPGHRPLERRAGAVENRQCPHRRRHRVPDIAAGARPRRSCSRSPASGPTSRNRGRRRGAC